ncbi:MAG: hypothetical protein V1775_00325 [Bacteroidota bacterium]
MLNFIIERAKQLGAQNCVHCGKLDFGFGLAAEHLGGGYCINCFQPSKKYSDTKTLQFALEIFKEINENYDDINSSQDKVLVIEFIESLLSPLRLGKMPSNDLIIRLQALLKGMDGDIGGAKIGGLLKFKRGVPGIVLATYNKSLVSHSAEMSLAICVLTINFINRLNVSNEFMV